MTVDQILSLEKPLEEYLAEFAGCFGRSEPRQHLATYVQGQLSNLPRKSAEPIAERFGVVPRTLQAFLSWRGWQAGKLRDRLQKIVARDHRDRQAIGLVDDSGHVKSGPETAAVQRQYCGRLGKVENCLVTVHLGYATHDLKLRALLDGEVYLPKEGWDDPERRKRAGIPKEVSYRPKWQIAVEQIRRARQNGVGLRWIVADEDYGSKPGFREGIAALKLWYVVEVPKSTCGWTYWPGPRPQGSPSTVEKLVSLRAEAARPGLAPTGGQTIAARTGGLADQGLSPLAKEGQSERWFLLADRGASCGHRRGEVLSLECSPADPAGAALARGVCPSCDRASLPRGKERVGTLAL